jgi:hypothetical protein
MISPPTSHHLLHRSLVLLHDIIQILRLSNDNGHPMGLPSTTVESNETAMEEMIVTAHVLV